MWFIIFILGIALFALDGDALQPKQRGYHTHSPPKDPLRQRQRGPWKDSLSATTIHGPWARQIVALAAPLDSHLDGVFLAGISVSQVLAIRRFRQCEEFIYFALSICRLSSGRKLCHFSQRVVHEMSIPHPSFVLLFSFSRFLTFTGITRPDPLGDSSASSFGKTGFSVPGRLSSLCPLVSFSFTVRSWLLFFQGFSHSRCFTYLFHAIETWPRAFLALGILHAGDTGTYRRWTRRFDVSNFFLFD